MDNFQTVKDLKVDSVINIYSDHKLQTKFEGKAKLVKRKEKGLTFMLYNENLLSIQENQVINKKTGAPLPFTQEQKENNRTYANLTIKFLGIVRSGVTHVNLHVHNLYLLLNEEVSEELENPKHLDMILNHYRKEWKICSDARGTFFGQYEHGVFIKAITNEQIIRFIQQTCLKNWCHSIWREELWVVEFITDGYSSPFKTTRRVRTLICINPSEDGQNSGILHYVTKGNSLISNADRKELREQEQNKEKEEELLEEDATFYTEEELEFLNEDSDIDVYDLEESKIVSLDQEGILEEFESQMVYEEDELEEGDDEDNESFDF